MAAIVTGAFSYIGETLLCCFGSAAFGLCCKSCPSTTNSTATRIAYALILLMSSVTAWVMLDSSIGKDLSKMAKYTGKITGCGESDANCDEHIWSQMGVFRVLFGPAVFFGLMAVLMINVKSSSDTRAGLQNGFWGLKLLTIIALCVGAFFIPNDFFLNGFGYVAITGAFFFLLIQLVLLVDFSHSLAESWVDKAEDGSKCHGFLLVAVSLGLLIASFAATIALYVVYTKPHGDGSTSSCGENTAVITINLILAIVSVALSINSRVQEHQPTSGLLTAAVIIAYCTYLTWAGITEANGACVPLSGSPKLDTATSVIGTIFTFFAVAYASLRTSASSQIGKLGMEGDTDESTALLQDKHSVNDDDEAVAGWRRPAQEVVDNERDAVLYNWSFFHFTFALAALYIAMVLTNWTSLNGSIAHEGMTVGAGNPAMWVRVVSAWLSAVLYNWTLVAPICLPNRDFS